MKGKRKTNAARLLDGLNIVYELREYPVDEAHLDALSVAQEVGLPPEMVFKTLCARGDRTGVLMAVIPAVADLDLKALAKASGNKSIALVALKELLPLTGYIRGGCSPLGLKKPYPIYIDSSCLRQERIAISAGQRGLQLLLTPKSLICATKATVAAIALWSSKL